jgi:hypothetical protein
MPLAARGSTAVRGIFPLLRAQILASHSRVEGTQELAEIPRAVLDLQGRHPDLDNPRYPGAFSELAPEEFRRLGERYLAATKVYRSSGKAGALRPYFIDKMPNNFRHIGAHRPEVAERPEHRHAPRVHGLSLWQSEAVTDLAVIVGHTARQHSLRTPAAIPR